MKKNQESVVEKYGRLQVSGNKIYDESGDHEVCLAGMSYFWSWISCQYFDGWGDKFYNEGTVNELVDNWNCDILRCAVAIEDVGENEVGYASKPAETLKIVCEVIDQCIARGIYVILDCHTHNAIEYKSDIINLLKDILEKYGDCKNIIYEIFNEPINQSWTEIKAYAEEIIPIIRDNGAEENIIIVGTPHYSQYVHLAAEDPIDKKNIAYTLHFYAATHLGYPNEEVRGYAQTALDKGNIALFVTEWGTVEADGKGEVDKNSTEEWMKFLTDYKISHLNWSVCDKDTDGETASALKRDSDPNGDWNYDEANGDLTESGKEVRPILLTWQETVQKEKQRTTEKV